MKINSIVMPTTLFGMSLLLVGLAITFCFEVLCVDLAKNHVCTIEAMPPAYVVANCLWTLGALILILPPLIEGVELLVVLEIFLVVSGLMSFWQPELFALKVASRISLSLIAVGYLKARNRLLGFTWPWSLLSPRFYYNAFTSGNNNALAVGLEMLGIGYALGSILMLTIGSVYLVRNSQIAWQETKRPIFAAFAILNIVYVSAGIVMIVSRLL